jgi:hypothetical protein
VRAGLQPAGKLAAGNALNTEGAASIFPNAMQ